MIAAQHRLLQRLRRRGYPKAAIHAAKLRSMCSARSRDRDDVRRVVVRMKQQNKARQIRKLFAGVNATVSWAQGTCNFIRRYNSVWRRSGG